ncbi:hypothetical protein cypCar_00036664 [Cyprinus carpio]|nr:hypothetical protein cypCar_00036664 [Cyprinus carpio]
MRLWLKGCFYKVGQFQLCKDSLGFRLTAYRASASQKRRTAGYLRSRNSGIRERKAGRTAGALRHTAVKMEFVKEEREDPETRGTTDEESGGQKDLMEEESEETGEAETESEEQSEWEEEVVPIHVPGVPSMSL